MSLYQLPYIKAQWSPTASGRGREQPIDDVVFGRMSSSSQRLRERIEDPALLIVPGCFDARSARLVQEAGAAAVFMSGFAVAAARACFPTWGSSPTAR